MKKQPVEEKKVEDPHAKRKEELLANPDFAKIPKMIKMKVPLMSILNQVRPAGKFKDDDVCIFASKSDIDNLKK